MVEQLLLSHADVKPGMIVRGTVAVVESFGALIQLAEGVRGLCPLQHMSEFERTTPSAKFQVCMRLSMGFSISFVMAKHMIFTWLKILL